MSRPIARHAHLAPTFTHPTLPDLAFRGPLEIVPLVALDTETCALGSGRDRIVQFCAVELDEDLCEVSSWTQLVNPERSIPKGATAIHGITDEMVHGQPTFREVGPRLRAMFRPDTVLIAYNAGFDRGVMNLEFARAGLPVLPVDQPVIDPLQIERAVLSRSLGPTYKRYTGRDLDNAHKADADTYAMIEVLRLQRQVHADKLPAHLEDLVEWPPRREARFQQTHLYTDPQGVVRFGFGRYKDRPAVEAPDYLAWMLSQTFPPAVKKGARTLLAQANGSA